MIDLFGQISVTWPEIYDWIETVAEIDRDSWRAAYYIEYWNVADKIRAWKLRTGKPLYTAPDEP